MKLDRFEHTHEAYIHAHTPGPWVAEGKTVKAVSHGQWFKIARADGLNHTEQGNLNNARLIAAAPDLLDALAELVKRCDGEEGVRADGSNIQTIRAHALLSALEGND